MRGATIVEINDITAEEISTHTPHAGRDTTKELQWDGIK